MIKKTIKLNLHGIVVNLYDNNGNVSGEIKTDLHVENSEENKEYNTSIDGIESLILAHACAGVDIKSKEYKNGITSAVDAIANSL